MLGLLRTIRRSLIDEGNLRKYLLYALGEIILVVIGILIALQINTNSSNRAESSREVNVLRELQRAMMVDAQRIQEKQMEIEQDISTMQQLKVLLQYPEHPYSADMDTMFGPVYGVRSMETNSAMYQDLKSAGLQLIKDDELRFMIVTLFEVHYERMQGIFENEHNINQVLRPYHLQNFHDITFCISATPNDFDRIWQDKYYHNIVDYRAITLQGNHLDVFAEALGLIGQINGKIDDYLGAQH